MDGTHISTSNVKSSGLLDKSLLLDIFEMLDSRLKDNNMYLEVSIYDGSVMNLLYDVRPATRDIDCIFCDEYSYKILNNILDDIKYIYNLSDNWLNNEVAEPLKYLKTQDVSNELCYSNLKVNTLSVEQMLVMKILSARPEPSNDFLDAGLLCRTLGIETKSQLLEVVSKFLKLSLIGERQQQFIKYLGDDLGYDWK